MYQGYEVLKVYSQGLKRMLNLQPIYSNLEIKVESNIFNPHSHKIGTLIDQIWNDESKKRGIHLTNGTLLSLLRIDQTTIWVRNAEYREFISQLINPDLFDILNVKPVAVTGFMVIDERILVFGQRSKYCTQDPEMWELVPSGGLSDSTDAKVQILTELREELGIDSSMIYEIEPFCLIEDKKSHVVDICIQMKASKAVSNKINNSSLSKEYKQVQFIPLKSVASFVKNCEGSISRVSLEILKFKKLIS